MFHSKIMGHFLENYGETIRVTSPLAPCGNIPIRPSATARRLTSRRTCNLGSSSHMLNVYQCFLGQRMVNIPHMEHMGMGFFFFFKNINQWALKIWMMFSCVFFHICPYVFP